MPAAHSWIVPRVIESAPHRAAHPSPPVPCRAQPASPAAPPDPTSLNVLVIGYGNELRTDDGVGPEVVRSAEHWALPGVECRIVQQLTPDLAERLSHFQRVIFVDAIPATSCPQLKVSRLRPVQTQELPTHSSDPAAILGLTQMLYQRCPEGWMIAVPAFSFAYGLGLSPRTRKLLPQTLEHLRKLLRLAGSG
jgi:hydrogenase maturation protease